MEWTIIDVLITCGIVEIMLIIGHVTKKIIDAL